MISKKYYCDCCGRLMFDIEYNEKNNQPFTNIFKVDREIHLPKNETSFLELNEIINYKNVCESCYKHLNELSNRFYADVRAYREQRRLDLLGDENEDN